MPKVGDLVRGRVQKIVDEGAKISFEAEGKTFDAFLPISEVSEKFVKRGRVGNFIKEGQESNFRVIRTRWFKGRQDVTVSLKRVDEEGFTKRNFEKKMKSFLKSSGEIQSQIRKNNDRKHGTLKKKMNKKEK